MVSAKQLQRAVADLQETSPWPGLVKTVLLATATVALGWTTFRFALIGATGPFLGAGFATGLVVAAWLITTHDALHHTLTGWRWFDEVVPRVMSYPMIWVHGMYAEVHKLHHKMNGDLLRDPERVQWTAEEYESAGPLGRFYARHQWFLDVFVFAGIGLIWQTTRQALKFYGQSKSVRRAVWLDGTCIVGLAILMYGWAFSVGLTGKLFCLWFILERMAGATLQWRSHVEHYGLWGKGRNYFETQAYVCRNLRSNAIGSWFFNRLNFHSVHHAFPRVPFYNLGKAHARFMELYRQAGGEQLTEDEGYISVALRLARHPSVIGDVDPTSPSGRRLMIPI